MRGLCIFFLIILFGINLSLAETVYFLAVDTSETTSFVVPMTDPNHIAHARDLITYGPGIGGSQVAVDVACGFDGVNRNLIAPSRPLWNWHITSVRGFFDISINPPAFLDLVADCPQCIADNGSTIDFEGMTIVEELDPIDAGHWQCDFVYDDEINVNDIAVLGLYWLRNDCSGPDWCDGADMNYNGIVDLAEMRICAGAWLSDNPYNQEPYWYTAWNCPTQCHGDTDCQTIGYPVSIQDLNKILNIINSSHEPVTCDDGGVFPIYDPGADVDRDCDIDEDDLAIAQYWSGVPASQFPTDCPIYP